LQRFQIALKYEMRIELRSKMSSMNLLSQYRLHRGLLALLSFLMAGSVLSQTYSPYTAEQLKQFNAQPIGLEETPAGPLYPGEQAPKPGVALGPHYSSQPLGEEEAEAQESGSAAAFDPRFSLFQF
jgi:hypothetical protein